MAMRQEKRTRQRWLNVLGGTLILCLATGCTGGTRAATCEYAQLYHSWDRNLDLNSTLWDDAEHSLSGEDLFDIYRALGGTKPPNKVKLIDVFNEAGRRGWRLVVAEEQVRGRDAGTASYFFVRESRSAVRQP